MTEYRDAPSTELPPQQTAPSVSPYGAPAPDARPSPFRLSSSSPESAPTTDPPGYNEPVLTTSDNAPATTADPNDSSMKDKAADSAQAGKQAAGEVAQTATDKAKDVAQEAKTQARNVVGQAQDQLREQASTQHQSLVTNLRSLGDQLTSMAERSDESGQATDLVAEAGSRVHSAAAWLDDREPGQLLDELRSFARRKPGVFVLGALVAGVAAGRLTRGVVAVHQDDSSDTAGAASPAQQQVATPNGSAELGHGSMSGAHSADALEATQP